MAVDLFSMETLISGAGNKPNFSSDITSYSVLTRRLQSRTQSRQKVSEGVSVVSLPSLLQYPGHPFYYCSKFHSSCSGGVYTALMFLRGVSVSEWA